MHDHAAPGRTNLTRVNYPVVGIPSFLRAEICTDLDKLDADVAVMGVPTDEGSPYLPGSRLGPRGIREQSLRFYGDGRGYYDPRVRRRFLEHEMAHRRLLDVGDKLRQCTSEKPQKVVEHNSSSIGGNREIVVR